jgi:hypothetical protein
VAKYDGLCDWLAAQRGDYVESSFAQIHDLVRGLPRSARSYPDWWGNDRRHVQAQAWLAAGFHVEKVNIAAEKVAFRRGT